MIGLLGDVNKVWDLKVPIRIGLWLFGVVLQGLMLCWMNDMYE